MKNLGQYASEVEGMEDFWKDVGLVPDYSCNTDGYYNGYLVEFKLNSIDASVYSGKAKSLKLAWDMVLTAARACAEFNPSYNYGLYQIETDLNIKEKVVKADGSYATNKKGEIVKEHKYPTLNAAIVALKKELTKYYTTYIVPKLFSYELLK